MRIVGYFLLGLIVLCVCVVAWPYRFEQLAQKDIANSSGCNVVISTTARKQEMLAPTIIDDRIAEPMEARIDIFGCSAGRDGSTPEAATLKIGNKVYRGADCGAASEGASLPCHIDFPANVPNRYVVDVQVKDRSATHSVVIDVRREYMWRARMWDAMMSV